VQYPQSLPRRHGTHAAHTADEHRETSWAGTGCPGRMPAGVEEGRQCQQEGRLHSLGTEPVACKPSVDQRIQSALDMVGLDTVLGKWLVHCSLLK